MHSATLNDLERIAYITGAPTAPFFADLVEAQGHAETVEEQLHNLITGQGKHPGAVDLCETLREKFEALRDEIETIAEAAGAARPSALRDAILDPIARATRARIDAQDALQNLETLFSKQN